MIFLKRLLLCLVCNFKLGQLAINDVLTFYILIGVEQGSIFSIWYIFRIAMFNNVDFPTYPG